MIEVNPDDIELTESNIDKIKRVITEHAENINDKPVKKIGDYYLVKIDNLKEDENKLENDYILEKLHSSIVRDSLITNFESRMMRLIYVVGSIGITVFGIAIGVLSLTGNCELTTNSYVAAILGFVSAGINTLIALFNLEKRGVLMKDISNRQTRLSRKLRDLQNRKNVLTEEKERIIDEIYTEMEDLDLMSIDSSILSLPSRKKKADE